MDLNCFPARAFNFAAVFAEEILLDNRANGDKKWSS